MDRTEAIGLALLVAGLAGYGAGIALAFPGRAFAVTAVMVGISLLAIGAGRDREVVR